VLTCGPRGPDGEGVGEVVLDAAERFGAEEGNTRRRSGPTLSSRTAPASWRRRIHVQLPASSPPHHLSTDVNGDENGEESPGTSRVWGKAPAAAL
jgi:hypothetical protein